MLRYALPAQGPLFLVIRVAMLATTATLVFVPLWSRSAQATQPYPAKHHNLTHGRYHYTVGSSPIQYTSKDMYDISPMGVEGGYAAESISADAAADGSNTTESDGIHVASWNWEYVRTPFIYTSFVVLAGLCKVGFHHANFLSSILPESCLLILLGTVIGAIIYYTGMSSRLPQFESRAFFLFLLPPIMLESAYSLHDRAFADNIGTILLYAVVGTLISCFTIGPTLFGLAVAGAMGPIDLPLVQALLFSALISAVDPVAVLAIFQEIGVNKDLYFLVFGESLLNDAVTVVLYNMMVKFTTMKTIPFNQIMLGVAAFICSSLGGFTIGACFGVFTALITKHTKEVRVVEPLALIGLAYLSYLTAEMVHFSGIISIIACGLVQMQYAKNNISMKSYTTVKYFSKMLSAACDCLIFLFLGMVLINDKHDWQTGFVLWSVFLCLIYRFMAVFFLTFLANKFFRSRRIGYKEQFIMAYGGLRGAVSFSLVIMLQQPAVPLKNLFVTCTLVIIFFTVFLQGGTIKMFVKCLELQSSNNGIKTLTGQVNNTLIDHVMAGVEQVLGRHGDFHLKQIADHYEEKYVRHWLQRSTDDLYNLCKVYEKVAIDDHYAHLYGPATAIEDCKKLSLYTEEDDTLLEAPFPDMNHFLEEKGDVTSVFIPSNFRPARDSAVRGSVSAPSSPPVDSDKVIAELRRAFQENPFKKYHQKFNPNLVHDEDQELSMQLRRRRLRSRRLTMTAMSPTISQHSSHSDISDEGVTLRPKMKRQPSTDTSDTIEFYKNRARQRRTTMSNFQRAKTIDHGTKGHLHSRVGNDFPGLDPANRPHSTGDLEMRHGKPLGTIIEMENGSASAMTRIEEERRPLSDPNVGSSEETRPLMKSAPIQPLHAAVATTAAVKPATPPKPVRVPPPVKRKQRLSKSHPVDIEDGDGDDNYESSV